MLNLTLNEIMQGLDNGQTFPSDFLYNAFVEVLEDTEKLDTLQEECDDYYDVVKVYINNTINALMESDYKYNTENKDAADAYSHCINDVYVHNNRQAELIAFCSENDISLDGIDIESLENDLINSPEWLSSHIYSAAPYYDKFVLACFPVGELENQIDFESIEGLNKGILQKLKDNNDLDYHCGSIDIDSALFYQNTDKVWEAYVSLETIKYYVERQRD